MAIYGLRATYRMGATYGLRATYELGVAYGLRAVYGLGVTYRLAYGKKIHCHGMIGADALKGRPKAE